ncbi:MAG TPA: FAD binding domain-containing protein [Polyangia bacterium]|nr:FAD binding domain-containing protein [Polyangia bacterium]
MRYLRPSTVAEAVGDLGTGATLLAGGTALVPLLTRAPAAVLLDLRQIEALQALDDGADGLRVGAMVTLARLLDAAATADADRTGDRCLAQAARSVGNPNVRRAATVGGNLALPAGDLHPALLVLEATVAISAAGQTDRDLPGSVLADGGIPGGALIRHVNIPREPGRRSAFVKFAWRAASGITLVSVAASMLIHDHTVVAARLAAAGVRARASRLPEAERVLVGQPAGDALFARAGAVGGAELPCEIGNSPSAAYRRRLVEEGLRRALADGAGR